MATQKKDWCGNKKSTWATLGASNHTERARAEHDYYATDPTAVEKLLSVETPSKQIWECAVGEGHLANALKSRGYVVYASDVVDRGYPSTRVADFLTASRTPFESGGGDILTNPPYKYATEFVLKALELLEPGHKCYMFLRLSFLEGRKRRKLLFDSTPPQTVYVFSERALCARNGDFESLRESGGSAIAFAWFVWQKGVNTTPQIKWI